jgi:hypothetical protein
MKRKCGYVDREARTYLSWRASPRKVLVRGEVSPHQIDIAGGKVLPRVGRHFINTTTRERGRGEKEWLNGL